MKTQRMVRGVCIKVRKTARNPVVLFKAIAKGTAVTVLPSEINDAALRHVEISICEVIHNVQDTIVLNAIGSCVKAFTDLA